MTNAIVLSSAVTDRPPPRAVKPRRTAGGSGVVVAVADGDGEVDGVALLLPEAVVLLLAVSDGVTLPDTDSDAATLVLPLLDAVSLADTLLDADTLKLDEGESVLLGVQLEVTVVEPVVDAVLETDGE